MKKLLAALVFSAACANVWGQITITKNNMPAAGDTFRYANVQVLNNGITVGNTGPNYNWVYGQLNKNDETVLEYKRSAQTSYAFYFFNTFGMQVAESLGFGQFALTDVYNFYKNTNSNFTAEGIGFKFNGIPLAGFYTDKDEIYKFPLDYGDKDSSSYRVTVQLPGVGSYKQSGKRVNFVDGWGKLTTPYKTYDCIRVKSDVEQVDSFSVSQPFPVSFGFPSTRTEYKWLSNSDNVPVLEVTGNSVLGNFVPTAIRYRYQSQGSTSPNTSVQQTQATQVSIYPNPATDKLVVALPSTANAYIKLFTIDGREQQVEYTTTANGIEVNTQHLSAGIYMLFAKGGADIVWQKVQVQ